MFAAACGGTESASEDAIDPTPTATPTEIVIGPIATPRPDPTPTPLALPDPAPTATPATSPSATPTPPPIPTASPTVDPTATATPVPTATATPVPTATATPVPTATATPTPTPTVGVRPVVSCSITPQRAVGVREPLVFLAESSPASVPVQFRFDHGDGTLDPGARSDAWYLAPGTYSVVLEWWSPGHEGSVACGVVTVVNEDGCWIGLGPADGLGWWCGSTFCPESGATDPGCPSERPWGCYTGMDGRRYCIERGVEPVMSCSISDETIGVNEVVTFRARQQGIEVPVDVVFLHGDGTRDPRWVAHAYYAAPGSYLVQMEWSWAGGSGIVDCGTVDVS